MRVEQEVSDAARVYTIKGFKSSSANLKISPPLLGIKYRQWIRGII